MYTLHAVVFDATDIIDQIKSVNLDPGIEELLESGDAGIDAEHASVSQQRPLITFTTTAIGKALAKCGIGGYVIDDVGGAPPDDNPIDFYFTKRAQGSVNDDTKCVLVRVGLGVMHLTSIRATHPEAAVAEFMVAAVSVDGAAVPLVITKDVALPAITTAVDEIWTCGPIYVNATKITPISEISLETGVQLGYVHGSGEVYPTLVFFASRAMRMEAATVDLSAIADLTALGVIRSAITRFFLRKKAQGATVEADASEVHVSFTLAEGAIRPGSLDGQHQGDGSGRITVTPTNDGTNNPIAVDTTAIITGV